MPYYNLTVGGIVPPGTYHFVGAPDAFLEAIDEVEQPADGYAPGTEIEVGGLGLRCAADSADNCTVTLHEDGSFTTTGTIVTVLAGGTFPMTPAEKQIAEANERAEEEKRRAEEEKAKADAAEEARQAAEEARQQEEERRLAAEAERQRLENEAEERRKADATERARAAISGTRTIGGTTTLAVGAIEYGEPAPVTTPAGPFTTSTGRSGRWSTTSHTAHREPERDTVEIYSDVEAPTRSAFRTSALNTGTDVGPTGTTAVIDGTNMVVGWVNIMNAAGGDDNHSRIADSGAFPREIGDPKPFALVDRGITETEYGAGPTDSDGNGTISDEELAAFTPSITRQQYNQYRAGTGFRDEAKFPLRYAYTTSGTLQGAGGTYRCNGAATTATCTVQNRGGSFEFDGDWDFIPSNGTVQIVVPDGQYMWFGWWARQTVRLATPSSQSTETWAFQADHGGTHPVTDLLAATGSATYTGPAAGRYAVYEPDTGESGIGSFTASATLQADFDASPNTVSGTITGFSNDPSWSLALKQKNITGGNTGTITDGENTVTWTIDGVPNDSGSWEAQFYANLPTDGTVTYQPHGIAGTFEAEYDPSGAGARAAVIGGFGARRD
ncbi:MAG: hypothetical protein OXP75_11205 [Rhodospirillales bacterium]|nr:hypothetical protein [Rhodospirillales bacterium]